MQDKAVWRCPTDWFGESPSLMNEQYPDIKLKANTFQLFKLYMMYFTGMISFVSNKNLGGKGKPINAISLPLMSDEYVLSLEREKKMSKENHL